jgi:hypothetical protein
LVYHHVHGVHLPSRARPVHAVVAANDSGNPLLDRLDPDDGRRLLTLPGELVWASTWLAEANDVIAPRLGLPVLPVVDWPDSDDEAARDLHWKTMFLTRWAAARPFVWLDDEITEADRVWVAAHHQSPALLHRVDPYLGLTDADFSAVRQWLGHSPLRPAHGR